MLGNESVCKVSPVLVSTTNYRGRSAEEVANSCADKIVSISETAPDAVREQAKFFKSQIIMALTYYIKEAIRSDRTTLYNQLKAAGHSDAAELIRRF